MTNENAFSSISQRVLFAYRFAYSEFRPIPSEAASERAQGRLHALMNEMQEKLYETPALLSLPMDADRAYPFLVCNNQIPELDAVYQAVFKALYEFYRFLYIAALCGEAEDGALRISREQLKAHKSAYKPVFAQALRAVSIDAAAGKTEVVLSHAEGADIFPAMRLLARENQREYGMYETYPPMSFHHNLFLFAACSFDGNLEYLLRRIDDMYGFHGRLIRLKADCLNQGYTYVTKSSVTGTDFLFTIQMRNSVGGFHIAYNPRKAWKLSFGTMNGVGEKAMLENFDRLDDDMKEYFLRICRPCNGCLGCTKGGRNKPFTVKASYQGRDYRLCPMFPTHNWETIDEPLIDMLMKYHRLQETGCR